MSQDTTMILGFALLAGGAYLYSKKQGESGAQERYTAPEPTGPVADQGKDDGVAPDAPSTGGGPGFATELAPESAQPPSGGNRSADDLSYLDRFMRDRRAISLQGSRIGGGTIVKGDRASSEVNGREIDGGVLPIPEDDGAIPSDPREAALLLE
jgi:hypothetical protein